MGWPDGPNRRDPRRVAHHQGLQRRNRICQRFAAINDKFYRTTNRIGRRQALAHPMSEFLGTTTIAIVLWFGGATYIERKQRHQRRGIHLLPHHLLQHYQSCQKTLPNAAYTIQRGLAAMERVDKILSTEKSHKEPREPGKQRRLEPLDRIPGHLVQNTMKTGSSRE